MSLLNEIDPLKQSTLAGLRAAADLAAPEHAKQAWIGPSSEFALLMKQLSALPKADKLK